MADINQYIAQYGPDALWGQQTYGIPADVLLAITASESNYGAAPTYFGIICAGYPTCETFTSQGTDCPGCAVSFRTYGSYREGIADFAQLVQNNYPQAWMNRNDPTQFLQDLQAGGYTSASEWVSNVLSLSNTLNGGLTGVQPNNSPFTAPSIASTGGTATNGPTFGLPNPLSGLSGSLSFLTDPIGYLRKTFATPFETAGVFILGLVAVLGGFLIVSGSGRSVVVNAGKEAAKGAIAE